MPSVENIHISYVEDTTNKCTSQSVELLAIPYSTNQPVDPQLWDRSFCSIFLFGLNEYLDSNAKNIMCSLLRIVAFTKQYKLEDKTTKDISQIREFGFVV